jgi:protein-disulfide isomerase
MYLLHKKGEITKMMALYKLSINAKETNTGKIIKAINRKVGTKFTKEEIFSPTIKDALRFDMIMKRRLQVTGTPTIFIDGKWDRLRKKYKKYVK